MNRHGCATLQPLQLLLAAWMPSVWSLDFSKKKFGESDFFIVSLQCHSRKTAITFSGKWRESGARVATRSALARGETDTICRVRNIEKDLFGIRSIPFYAVFCM